MAGDPTALSGSTPPPDVPPDPEPPLGSAEPPATLRTDNAARGAMLTLVGTFVGAAANFAMLAVVARSYGATAFGVFSGITALFLVLAMVTRLGADMGATWFVSRLMSQRRRREATGVLSVALTPVVLVSGLVGIVLFLGAEPLARVLSDPAEQDEWTAMLRVVALGVPIATVGEVLLGATRGFGAMRPTVVSSQIGRQVGQLVTVALAATVSDDLRLLALAWVVPYVGTVVYPVVWLRSTLADRVEQPERPWDPFWRYAGPQGANQTAQIGLEKFDIIVLGPLAGVAAQGAYSAANRLAHLVVLAWYAINLAHGPLWAYLFESGREPEVSRSARMVTGWAVLLVGPILWTYVFFGDVWVGFLGSGLDEGGGALALLAVALLAGLLLGPCENLLLMAGGSGRSFLNNLAALAVNIALNLVLVPRYGVMGAATAWFVALMVVRGLATFQVWSERRVTSWSATVVAAWLLVAVCVGGAGLIARTLLGPTRIGLAAAALVGVPLLAGVVWFWRDVFRLDELVASVRRRPLPSAAAPGRSGILDVPHLEMRVRSRAAVPLPLTPGRLRLLVDAVPAAGWRGRLSRDVVAWLAPHMGRHLHRLPLLRQTEGAPVPIDRDRTARIITAAVERIGEPVDGLVWLLPPGSHERRFGVLLLVGDTPVAHVRIRADDRESAGPRPAIAIGERSGVEWPLVLDRWTDGELRCELTTALDVGRHSPARLSTATLLDVVDDLADALVPTATAADGAPMHGDLTPWNLRSTADGRLLLFDWEHAGFGPPDADLVRYLAASRDGVERFAALPEDRRRRGADAVAYWTDVVTRRAQEEAGVRWKRRDQQRELAALRAMADLAGAPSAVEPPATAPDAAAVVAAMAATPLGSNGSGITARAPRSGGLFTSGSIAPRRGPDPASPARGRPAASPVAGPAAAEPVRLLAAARRFRGLILAAAVIGAVAGFAIAFPARSEYVASARLVLKDPWGVDPVVTDRPVGGDFERFVRSQAEFAMSDTVIDAAAATLGMAPAALANTVHAEPDTSGTVLLLDLRAGDPVAAETGARMWVETYREQRQDAVDASVERTLDALADDADGADLAGEMRVAAAVYGDGVAFVDLEGQEPVRSTLGVIGSTLIGAGVGLTAGLVVAWVWATRRRRVEDPAEPGRRYGLLYLGTVPGVSNDGAPVDLVDAAWSRSELVLRHALTSQPASHPRGGHVVVVSGVDAVDAEQAATQLARAAGGQGARVLVVDAAGTPDAESQVVAATAHHDLVVVACPPPVTDSATARLGVVADGTVLVVPWGVAHDELDDVVKQVTRLQPPHLSYVVVA